EDVFSNFRAEDTTTTVTMRSDLQLGEQNTLAFGYRDEEREGVSVGAFERTVDIRSFFAENRWSSADGRVHLSVGVRNDDHSTFGDETTYRLTVSARLSPSSRLHGSYGTGFKAPTFFDLFFPGFGNPDLLPETSEGFDLGYEGIWAAGRWEMGFTVFANDFEDLIQFTFPAGLVNVAEARSEGFELEGSFAASERLRLRASHTFTDTEDLQTGLQLARRPEHRTAVHLDLETARRWRASLSAFAVRDRIDSDGTEMDDYERLDLSAEYELTPRLTPYLRVENLFDQDYEEVPGYTARGITALVGLAFDFR
ncbi:MAG: TonB-dependent receptor, partial [Holophagales bacterium]|nr:TonB-dependent receptor [Holophagales bacterium]